ncbi:AtpZ/AtpI family protein [Methylococcus sp. EFPC2]|uniref:AtpZ/AtpI family protein n=1 Tax=Methylococcus sp. EFPC2 TaxID=2812648 RepID=UPI001967D3E1|nr:AtpZ/AtpI family protein [Methylococcus sp. EFPC2]QSA98701.1 AtpZ/AtpI family protein [Methylococcus sp. EFPC2]
MNPSKRLQQQVEKQAGRMRKAERERKTLLAQTLFVGSLGLMMGIPVVLGAYLGLWLDGFSSGYSVRWTVGFILLGVIVGAYNVYRSIQE